VALGTPSLLHEQNAVIGRANKFLAPRVTRIASASRSQGRRSPQDRFVGNPVRPAVLAAAAIPYSQRGEGRLKSSSPAARKGRG